MQRRGAGPQVFAPNWRDNPELCKMRADRFDQRGLLADEQMARAMQHQVAAQVSWSQRTACLACWCLADGLGVSSMVLLTLDVRLPASGRLYAQFA
jgi:hypothetical protein